MCITERYSSIKKQTIYIGPVQVVMDPFFLEGVLHIKLTSHVSIYVSTRMIFVSLGWVFETQERKKESDIRNGQSIVDRV